MEVLIFLFIVVLAVTFLIYRQHTSQKQREAMQQAQEEKTQRYIEEIQRVGEEYDRSGIPARESEIALKRGETLHAILRETQWMEHRKARTGRVAGHGLSGRVRIAKG